MSLIIMPPKVVVVPDGQPMVTEPPSTDLYAHFDSSDPSTLVMNSFNVETWNSKINTGTVFATNPNSTQQPVLTGRVEKPVVASSIGDGLLFIDTTGQIHSNMTVVLVSLPRSGTTSGNHQFTIGGDTDTPYLYSGFEHNVSFAGNSPNSLDVIGGFSNDRRISRSNVSQLNDWHVWCFQLPSGEQSNMLFWDDGYKITSIEQTSTGADGTMTVKLGPTAFTSLVNVYHGRVGGDADFVEVLVYDRILSNKEIRDIQYYLGTKWGYLGVNAGHSTSEEFTPIGFTFDYDSLHGGISNAFMFSENVDLSNDLWDKFTMSVEVEAWPDTSKGINIGLVQPGVPTNNVAYTGEGGRWIANASVVGDAGPQALPGDRMRIDFHKDRAVAYLNDVRVGTLAGNWADGVRAPIIGFSNGISANKARAIDCYYSGHSSYVAWTNDVDYGITLNSTNATANYIESVPISLDQTPDYASSFEFELEILALPGGTNIGNPGFKNGGNIVEFSIANNTIVSDTGVISSGVGSSIQVGDRLKVVLFLGKIEWFQNDVLIYTLNTTEYSDGLHSASVALSSSFPGTDIELKYARYRYF